MSEAEGSGIYDAEYSDSDSDDESETGLSEESDSDSSDGSDVEEEDDDDDEFITEESQIVEVQEASGISSDEGGEKESCPICLNRFIGQDLGTPESCDHIFCLECIREWSKNINTCPIDRTEFNYVNLKSTPNGKILKKIKVKVRPKEPENALQQEVTQCEVCHLGDREDRLLLCDACDLAYHCECLDPPLFRVPIEEWFCPPCSGILQNGAVAGPSVPRSRRVIPRTRASENVRTRVQDRRTQPAIPRSPSNARKRTPQKRKRRAYRRSYKKVVTLARTKKNLMDGSKGKVCPRSTAVIVTYRRRRRRRKKRRVATKSASASKSRVHSAKKRISKHLGLVESSKGGSIPDVKSKTKSTSKSVIPTGSSHYLFGNKNQLMDFNESFHEDGPGPSRRQQEVVTPQPSSSSINILDSIIAGQKILHTKSNDVIIKTDGSLVLKENKTKEKGIFKKPLGSDKAKDKEIVKKPNASEKSNEKEKGAIKKSNFYDKTKDQRKGVIKKSDASNKVKSSRVTFGEPSDIGAIPKAEKHSERKPSPMLLAALARRRENEMSDQSVSDYKSKNSSSIERIATSTYNHQHSSLLNQSDHNLDVQTNIDRQNFSKWSSFSLKSKINKSSSSFETVNKPFNYSHESSLKKSVRTGPIKSNFDDFQNSSLSNSSSDYLSFSCTEPNTSRVKNETDNKRSFFKCENTKESSKHSCLSPKQELNNVSRFHDVALSTSFERTRSARQSCDKNENISSNGHVKKTAIQKYIKKEETNDFLSEKSTVANSSTNATMLISSETEINDEEEDTMELILSQSLIQGNSDVLLTSFSDVKQLPFDIKKEPYSFSEKSDSECSQSLVEPLHKRVESNSHSPHKSLNNKVSNLKLRIKKELVSSEDDCQSPNIESSHSLNKSLRQTINATTDDDDTIGFEDSQSIITQSVAETTAKTGQAYRKRYKVEINSSDDETNICHVSKSYSQSKPMNNFRNNNNVSEDFSKIKIKEELPSSEDAGGESCSLLTDDLPFTQLAEINNLPYTHLKNPTFSCTQAINSPFNEQVNDLPCTQLAETTFDKKDKLLFTHSSKSPFNKPEDDLPCTQLVEILDEQEYDLPSTQLVKPASIKSRFRKDDLPCTQFVKPALVNYLSKKDEDALQSTQTSSPLSNMQMDDLPCTQLVEPSSVKSFSNEREDALPCTQLARPVSSMEMEDLQYTQFVVPASIKDISVKEEDALPATRPSSPVSQMQTDDLPCTQLAKPLSSTQMDDLLSTKFSVPAPVKYPSKKKVDALPATQPSSPLSQIQMDDLPCTQLVELSSKKSVSNEEEDLLPCTQLARPVSDIEMEDLPCTQLARPLSNTQLNDLPNTQFVVPTPVKYPSKKKVDVLPATQPASPLSQIQMDDLPCTQLVEPSSVKSLSDKEDVSLPCTQLATPVSQNDHHNQNAYVQSKELPTCNGKLGYDAQAKRQQSGKLQEAKNSHENLPTTQPNTSIEHIIENSENLSCLNSNFDDDFDLPETQPLTFDQHHSKSKKLLQENSNDEQVTDEELLCSIDKLKFQRPPARKVVGVHKNLPQVLMPIPSRRIPVPKPFNRKTFSFDQVKQQYDAKDNKSTLQENISLGRMLAFTKIDLSTKQTLSSVLKEKQQVSSECKAENADNFKNEKYPLFVDEPAILVSSIPNCDLKVKIDKSSVPADSEIEIINDNEIMRMEKVEVVLSSDEEDLPATQFIDRITDQCSNLRNQKRLESFCIPIKRELNNSNISTETQQCIVFEKSVDNFNVSGNDLEKVVVKKEITLDDFKVNNVKTLNSLSVKQEKCEQNLLKEIKMEPLQYIKTEEKVSRLIKSENKSHDSEDITIVRNIQSADRCTNQKMSNTKNNINNKVSRCVRSHEKHVREHKSKTDISDHNKKAVRDRSSSSDVKVKFEKEKKRKTEGSSEMRIHSNAENKAETKIEDKSLSKTNSNSNMKLNTENVNQIKLVSKDKKPKTEHISSSHTHAKGEHVKNHKLVTEKHKSSSKEDNYHEDSKRRKHNSLDVSKEVQDHKKLKVDSFTIKKEPTTDKNGKHGFEKSFGNKKETHKFKNNIKKEDSTGQKSSERSAKTDKMSNSGKVKETHVSNGGKSRNDNKSANVHNKTFESQNSSKSSSEVNSKVAHSSSHDKKINCKYVNSDNKGKEFGNITFNDKERLNGRIIGESDSEKRVSNRLKESKTNFKDESTRTSSVVKRSDSSEGERNTKRPRLESLSCNEDTTDCHSDYSRSSEISSESNFRKKYKHQRYSLSEIADEIISASKNCKTDILNQDENVDLEVIKKSKDPSSLGRKVDKAHLKDEIAAEVKIALKPFYTVGLIDKEDYKDIMRKAVPKIFMNCGNYVHPEKIKNLVTSYVKKLTNS